MVFFFWFAHRMSGVETDTVDLHGTTSSEAVTIVKDILNEGWISSSTFIVSATSTAMVNVGPIVSSPPPQDHYRTWVPLFQRCERAGSCSEERSRRRRMECCEVGCRSDSSRKVQSLDPSIARSQSKVTWTVPPYQRHVER